MITKRLELLKEELRKNNLEVYYFGTADDHLSEYVSEYYKTIKYFSGFTGSLATLIVDLNGAHIFVDGRYHIQAEKECAMYGIKVHKLGLAGVKDPITFLKENYNCEIGLDGKRISTSYAKKLIESGIRIRNIDIYSNIIENRSDLPFSKVYELDIKYTGKTRKDKIKEILYCLDEKVMIINNLEAIAYTLNLRGDDIPCTPVFLSHLVFTNDEVYLFTNLDRFDSELLDKLYSDGIIIRPYISFYSFIDTIVDQTILIDEDKVNYQTYSIINKDSNKIYHMRSIPDTFKAIKNETERKNARLAHEYDAVAMIRFLKWIKENDLRDYTEYDLALKLKEFRLSYKAFDESFNSIIGYNENAAIMHYMPSKDKAKRLDNKGILLVDSGGQYLEGTTDITRTFALGEVEEEAKKFFTLVLKSMFSLSDAVFIKGTTGRQLDILARKDLWHVGLDYRHGTGHGVGQTLSVHDSPPRINNSKSNMEDEALLPGMIVSDEPGLYFENKYGFRCENLILCDKAFKNEYGEFYKFEILTLVPFDLNLIDKNYLDARTIEILNSYHKEIRKRISPYLNDEEIKFLEELTREI